MRPPDLRFIVHSLPPSGVSVDRSCVVESGFRVTRSRRFTIVIADRRTGAYRRFGLRPVPALAAVALLFLLPVLVGMGLKWSARAEISALQSTAQRLDLENRNFRAATGELTTQLQSLQAVVGELGRQGGGRQRHRARHGPAPGHREVAGRRRPDREPAVVALAVLAPRRRIAGRHVRRAARPALHAREPPADRAARTWSGARRWPRRPRRSGRRAAG